MPNGAVQELQAGVLTYESQTLVARITYVSCINNPCKFTPPAFLQNFEALLLASPPFHLLRPGAAWAKTSPTFPTIDLHRPAWLRAATERVRAPTASRRSQLDVKLQGLSQERHQCP
ncbi:hypothetical protein diail_9395 [Diaporthe ilicicola]|nr:hypothetical protein diail_9395 [Diaporthe ilicicola]